MNTGFVLGRIVCILYKLFLVCFLAGRFVGVTCNLSGHARCYCTMLFLLLLSDGLTGFCCFSSNCHDVNFCFALYVCLWVVVVVF